MIAWHSKLSVLVVLVASAAHADTIGAVEPIVDPAVLDLAPLAAQPLDVRTAFAERVQACGFVADTARVLAAAHATPTFLRHAPTFTIAAGGFAGDTNPTYAFSIGAAASQADLRVLTDGLGFVLSQGSVFLLDPDDPTHFDFPTNYVVLEFHRSPTLARSAELFETVGDIDPDLFETDSSGYTQVGRAYVSLQSDVPDAEFIAGYVAAAARTGVTYTPIVDGAPALFTGGAAFPGNDWTAHPRRRRVPRAAPGSHARRAHAPAPRSSSAHAPRARRARRSPVASRGARESAAPRVPVTWPTGQARADVWRSPPPLALVFSCWLRSSRIRSAP